MVEMHPGLEVLENSPSTEREGSDEEIKQEPS